MSEVIPWEGLEPPPLFQHPQHLVAGSSLSISPAEHLCFLISFTCFQSPQALPPSRVQHCSPASPASEAMDFMSIRGQGVSWKGPVPSLPTFSTRVSLVLSLCKRNNYEARSVCQELV